MADSNLLVVGSMAYDDIESPVARGTRLLGGSASHFSLAAALTGALPEIVAVVGDDFAQADLDLLRRAPADLTGVEQVVGQTFSWGGRYNDDFSERETLFTELGVFESFNPVLNRKQREASVLFLANIHPALQLQVLADVETPDFVGLDTMNLWIDQTPAELRQVIGKVDLLMLNDEEARQLTGERNLLLAGRKIQTMGPVHCMLKKGEHGVLLFSGDDIYPYPAFPVTDVVDPTGAGDAFAGGVMGYLAGCGEFDTQALRRGLLYGTVLGSFAVEGLGVKGLQNREPGDVSRRVGILQELLNPVL